MIRSTFGLYIPALTELISKHGDQIQIICGHDGVSFEKNNRLKRISELIVHS